LACSGFYVSIFQWTAGQWLEGQVVSLNWLTKQFQSTNVWAEGISFTNTSLIRLVNVFLQPVGAKFAYDAKADGFCRWSLVLDVLQALADNCGSAKRSISERSSSGTIVGNFMVWSNQAQIFNAGHVTIEVTNTSLTSSDSSNLIIYGTSASSLITTTGILNTYLTQLIVPILNGGNVPIGQLVSDGFQPTFTPALEGSFTMCIVKRNDITPASCYVTPDFATGVPLQPMNIQFTYEDSENLCASFATQPSTPVFAIMRVNNWQSVTVNPCPLPATASTTGSHVGAASSIVASTLLIVLALIALVL